MNGNHMEIAGNLASDPELRFTASGTPVVKFDVGVTERKRNTQTGQWEDAGVSWFRVIVWGNPAENVAASLLRGMRVMVSGKMRQRSYEDKEGGTRYVWELTAEEVGPSLMYATADVKRVTRSRPNGPDDTDQWAGMSDATRNRPEPPADASSERAAEPASPDGAAESAVSPEGAAASATVATGAGSASTGKRARSRAATATS